MEDGRHQIARLISEDFYEGRLDLSARPGAPAVVGWDAMPEVIAAAELSAASASASQIRVFLTLMSAMDRARAAGPLWRAGPKLFRGAS